MTKGMQTGCSWFLFLNFNILKVFLPSVQVINNENFIAIVESFQHKNKTESYSVSNTLPVTTVKAEIIDNNFQKPCNNMYKLIWK